MLSIWQQGNQKVLNSTQIKADQTRTLILAVIVGAVVITLIKAMTKMDLQELTEGNFPLHVAASRGYDEPFRELIKYKATLNATNNLGVTPLMTVACGGVATEKLADLLISLGANIKLCDSRGQTALHFALFSKDPSPRTVASLLEVGVIQPNLTKPF